MQAPNQHRRKGMSENALIRVLFPEVPRRIPYERAWNVALRTAHIAVTGILLGGHVFGAPEADLRSVLSLCLLTGAGLMALGIYPTCLWLFEGRGLMVLLKLLLLGSVPFFWQYRVPLLMVIVVVASVGSHMPSRFRHRVVIPWPFSAGKRLSGSSLTRPRDVEGIHTHLP